MVSTINLLLLDGRKEFFLLATMSPSVFHFMAFDVGRGVMFHALAMTLFPVALCEAQWWNVKEYGHAGGVDAFLFVPALLLYALPWRVQRTGAKIMEFNWHEATFIILAAAVFYCLLKIRGTSRSAGNIG